MNENKIDNDTLANTQEEQIVEQNTSEETSSQIETKSLSKRKKTILIIIGAVLALLAALVVIAAPWVKPDTTTPDDIIPEQMEQQILAVDETKLIDIELLENETLVSFVSDCPEALDVSADGLVTAKAEANVTVIATIRETEAIAPEQTGFQKFRSRLRVLLGIEDAIDYTTLDPRIMRIVEYPFKITGVPTEEIEFLFELYVDGTAEFAEIEKEDGEVFRVSCEDESVAIMETETMVKAIAPGETSIIFTFGIEAEVDGALTFLPTRSKILPLKVNAFPTSGSKPSSSSPVNVTGSLTGGTGLSGGTNTGSSTGGTGGSSSGGSTGGGSTGGGTTRTYPLPSESEVSSFVSTALGYANGLGLGTNASLNTGNAGYGSPACTWELPWSDVKGEVYWQIDQINAMAAADPGFVSGMAVINITYTFSGGEYYIYVMWG